MKMNRNKNIVNRNLPSILHRTSIRKDDILQCPGCESLDLKEKLYIVNPEARSVEISGLCGTCDKPFNKTLKIVPVNSVSLSKRKKRLEAYLKKVEALKKSIEGEQA